MTPRLVEIMEARSLVGSQDGVKPREILLRPDTEKGFTEEAQRWQGHP